jgi:hypothetical protein
VITLGFCLGEQLPCLPPYVADFAQEIVTEPFLALLAGFDDDLGNVDLELHGQFSRRSAVAFPLQLPQRFGHFCNGRRRQ